VHGLYGHTELEVFHFVTTDGHVSISVERFHLRGNNSIVLDVGSDSVARVDWTYCCKLESRRTRRGNLECHRVLDEES
jgi:hypothetical protein